MTSLVLLSVSSSDSSREAPSMCSWRRPDRLAEKLIGPPRLESRESVWARPQQLVAGKSFNHLTTQLPALPQDAPAGVVGRSGTAPCFPTSPTPACGTSSWEGPGALGVAGLSPLLTMGQPLPKGWRVNALFRLCGPPKVAVEHSLSFYSLYKYKHHS